MLSRKAFLDPRDYDVLVSSPELYKKYNDQRDSLSSQLNKIAPTRNTKSITEDERLVNTAFQKALRPEKGDEVHHKNALSLIGIALDNADDMGKAQIYNLLEQNGINIGDDIYNLINLPLSVHKDHHRFTVDQGLEMHGKGTKGLARLIQKSSDNEKTLEYLQDYIDYGIPLIEENINDLLTAYHKSPANLDKIRTRSVDATNMKRFAADNDLARAIMASMREESPGDNRDRALVVDSGGGDVTIGQGVLRNGKNGNGHNNGAA